VAAGYRRYPAVISFATPPEVEDSCAKKLSVADNFLQKQQKQRGPIPGTGWLSRAGPLPSNIGQARYYNLQEKPR
jgi:hypothetical protein